MKMNVIPGVSIVLQLVIVAIILLVQGTTLFILAKKRGKKAWLWGLIGLIQFPLPTIFYYFIVVRLTKKKGSEGK